MDKKIEKIVVVTVTYNSPDFLKRCINSLKKQTYPIDKIIVVDNNSKPEIQKTNKELIDKQIDYLLLNENTGGAGGFEHGMRRALEYNPDWIWLMDDDAFPKDDCLEILLKHKNYDNVGCICPSIFGVEWQQYQTYHHKTISKHLFKDSPKIINHDDFPEVLEIDANAFVGPLVSKKAIDKVGIANGGLFIYGDDTEYTYRVSRQFSLIVVKNAIINHRDVSNNISVYEPKYTWKEYYMYRNKYLFYKEFSPNVIHRILPRLYLDYLITKTIISTLLKGRYKHYRRFRIKTLLKGRHDGLRKKVGKIIDPATYKIPLAESK